MEAAVKRSGKAAELADLKPVTAKYDPHRLPNCIARMEISNARFELVSCTRHRCLLQHPQSESASAQGRVFVSGNGTDNVDCGSVIQPCATIGYANVKLTTGNGGRIVCKDTPATSTAFTITKSVIIDCIGSAAQVYQITISAGANDVVALRGVSVGWYGSFGILFNSGAALTIEDCTIRDVTSSLGIGVDFQPSTASTLTIINSSILANGTLSGGGGGLRVAPTSSGSARAFLKNVTLANNYVGLAAIGSGNLASIDVENSTISNNSAFATYATGTGGVVTLRNSAITGNGGAASLGNVLSYGDNRIVRNNPDTTPATAGGFR